jgi:hypothetical protein
MAEFKTGNVLIADEKSVVWNSGAYIIGHTDGSIELSATSISGIDAMVEHGNEYHTEDFATENYVDTVSGVLQGEIDGKSDLGHNHDGVYAPVSHSHDDLYYTEAEIDTISGTLNSKINTTSGTLQDAIDNIVMPTDFYSRAEVDTISGSIVDQIPTDYISDSEITTISGNIVSQIITDHGGLTGLSDNDHPQYDFSTASGILNSKIDTTSGTLQDTIDNIVIPTDFYTQSEVDTISGAIVAQIPSLTGYATESYVDTVSGVLDAAKSDVGHSHNDLYYTEGEVDTISGSIVAQIPTDYATEAELTSVSGALQDAIDSVEAPEAVEEGIEDISNGTDTVSITFSTEQPNTSYAIEATIENTTDATPASFGYVITAKATTGFTLKLSSTTDSANYKLNWRIGGFTLSGGLSYVANILYGTGDPPDASTVASGTLFLRYEA